MVLAASWIPSLTCNEIAGELAADVALREDQPDAAAAHFQASRVYYADTNDLGGLATAEQGLGLAAVGRGELETAARHYRQALLLVAASSYVPRIMSLLNHTSELLLYSGDREDGRKPTNCWSTCWERGAAARESRRRLGASWRLAPRK